MLMTALLAVAAECARFVARHLRMLPVIVVLLLPLTAVHEGAHALAAVAQGARLTSFEVGPWTGGPGNWGSMSYAPRPGTETCRACVSLAPYVLWALVGAVTAVAGFAMTSRTRERSWLFVFGFALPPLDLLQNAGDWLHGGGANDLTSALGAPQWPALAVIGAYAAAVACAGFPLQRRLYGAHALSLPAYALLTLATVLAAPLVSRATAHALA